MNSKVVSSIITLGRCVIGARIKLTARSKCLAVLLAVAGAQALFAASVSADSLNLGVLGNYAVVDLANGKTLGQNSGPINGSELLGNGVTAAFSGGGHGAISGTVYYDPTVLGTSTFSQFQPAPVTSALPDTTLTGQALTTAQNLSVYAAGLMPTQTFTGSLSATTTITGNGGLNVIDFASIQNAPLTFKGSTSDTFVLNVSGTLNTNVAMTLNGVSASQLLWNFTGTSGNVFQTSGGNTVDGTFLATKGGGFNFSNLDLNGELINTAGDVQIVSGSEIPTFSPFTAAPLPLPGIVPSALVLFGALAASKLPTAGVLIKAG